MADLDKIRARLEALRNMTVANGCTEAEALAAAEKMAELLARHGMTPEQLEALGFAREEVVTGTRRDPLESVWIAVSRFADCLCWLSRGERVGMVYFGRPQDVMVAQYVHDVLKRAYECDLARFRASDQYRRRRLARTRGAAQKAFTTGWAEVVSSKLYQGLWRRDGSSRLDVVRRIEANEAALKRAAADGQGIHLKPCRALAKPQSDTKRDRHAGQVAGSKVEVNAGVGAGRTAGLLS